ncbi:hypothetical protein NliqN6_3203 [Naganishia liquefaciens]|uniref:Alternative oxidase n=1 Tax=Naganishia liquefaciens TaxID=104408 RepID=A0A8H3YGL7_9TREE|nr:hypothetical protein NliqN6_3203 [Naganishia liquefaciens]
MHHQTNTIATHLSRRLSAHLSLSSQASLLRPTGIYLNSCTPLHQAATQGIAPSSRLPLPLFRTLTTSARALHSPSSPSRSTALLESVRHAEEGQEPRDEVGQKLQEGGKGTEGAHYKDTKSLPVIYDLADPNQTGTWTLSHPIYTEQEVNSVKVVWRAPKTIGDWIARGMVHFSRWGFDFVTGYRHKERPAEKLTVAELRKGGYIFDDKQWLLRIIFLESIAGVPGMVAGMLRHLRSLRLMRRDGGWIHTLLEEAENERMHLLTFMTIKQPSILLRAMVLGAQGVFFNMFFLTYLFSPRAAHRFVGHLEEQATYTYTQCIKDMEEGLVPEWNEMPAPKIAIDYWRLPEDAKLLDVIKAVRLDECQHRIVNHTLANLDQKHDFNPFAFRDLSAAMAGSTVELTREQAAKFVTEVPPLPIAAEHAAGEVTHAVPGPAHKS